MSPAILVTAGLLEARPARAPRAPCHRLRRPHVPARSGYQRTEGELRRLILESVYTGETDQPPNVAASEEESLKLLASLPGSVALVPAEMTLPSGLKAVRIDGKRSSELGLSARALS